MAQTFTTPLFLACLLMTTGGSSTTTEGLATTAGGGGVQPPATVATKLPTVGGLPTPTTSTTGGTGHWPTAAAAPAAAVMLPAVAGGGINGLSTRDVEAPATTTGGSGQQPAAAAVTTLLPPTVGGRGRGLSTTDTEEQGGGRLPLWVERLLALGGAPPSLGNMVGTTHVFVDKNATSGDGQFASITAALAAQTDQVGSEHSILCIFIKEGVYTENINISRKHVILIGQGAGKTVITGNKSHGFHNLTTPETATVSVHGKGFMAQDLTIQNTAGPKGEQAVALMSRSNFSLVYRCSIEGYQDTLNADTGDQIYLETDIRGTVDFVFGYAKASFLGCRLLVRSSGLGASKQNVITAQGRSNPADRSGFSFQNCSVTADEGADLTGVSTFLGRPWKNHSHVIFMVSFLGSIVNFTGWLEWAGHGPIPETVLYLEYANYGPGADTSRRINTTGVRTITDCRQAARYTADPFVHANVWMPKDKEGKDIIPYARGLTRDPAACPPAPPTSA